MDWLKNCRIRMSKGSRYNGMKLTKDIEVIDGEPYANGVKSTWKDVTENREMTQRVVNRSFSQIKNMTIKGNEITIDGVQMKEWFDKYDELEVKNKEVLVFNITINGNVEKLKADHCETIEIFGNAEDVETMSGRVSVSGDVKGDVETMSGDVTAKEIHGDVSTMSGNINR